MCQVQVTATAQATLAPCFASLPHTMVTPKNAQNWSAPESGRPPSMTGQQPPQAANNLTVNERLTVNEQTVTVNGELSVNGQTTRIRRSRLPRRRSLDRKMDYGWLFDKPLAAALAATLTQQFHTCHRRNLSCTYLPHAYVMRLVQVVLHENLISMPWPAGKFL